MPFLSQRRVLRTLGIVLVVVATLLGAAYGLYRYTFPYGWSHCCLIGLGFALRDYATENGGHFPAGAGCPEASLSLLYRGNYGIDGSILCGKTKSADAAQKILEGGGLLGPDTCDWHYVEGLTLADNPQLAIVWDKVGLGHNGQRLSEGGHSVWRLDGGDEIIPGSEWPQFLEEQERLMAARTDAAKKEFPALTAKIRLPSGEIFDHYDARYTVQENRSGASGGGGSWGGSSFGPVWWYRLPRDGTYTYTIWLKGWKSKPVEVKVSEGKATPDSIIFEMQAEKTERSLGPHRPSLRFRERGLSWPCKSEKAQATQVSYIRCHSFVLRRETSFPCSRHHASACSAKVVSGIVLLPGGGCASLIPLEEKEPAIPKRG